MQPITTTFNPSLPARCPSAMPISAHLCQASAMLLAVCPLVAALQTGFGRPGLVQAPSVSTGPARFAAASPYSSARLPAAVSMIATDIRRSLT